MRESLRGKKRIVIKAGSSSLMHRETDRLDLIKLEILVRELCEIRNRGCDAVLVSSGAIAVGRQALGIDMCASLSMAEKQACAAVGQGKLMMVYQKLFGEYNRVCGQVLLTKETAQNEESLGNARGTFEELMKLGVVPVVNENDTVTTDEIDALAAFGDNDTLSAVVADIVGADLLMILSDIDGLYTDDPHRSSSAEFIDRVDSIDEHLLSLGKDTTGTGVGTGGMATKLKAAKIAVKSGIDTVIASGEDFHVVHHILAGEEIGTFFTAHKDEDFNLIDELR
jgi:glutamate 5-kinase